jgi:aryl-alcohol dehydrogenase-like predicted oxidoreductase
VTSVPRPAWLVAGTTTAVRAGRDLLAVGEAVAVAGFTHVAVADADPGTIPAARAALDHGVPGVIAFVSPVLSWTLGAPPPVTDAYPPTQVRQSVERTLAALDREAAEVVLAHKWDPAWRGGGEAVFEEVLAAGAAVRTGVSCPDSHPGAAAGIAAGQAVCASWNVHDQALATHIADYRKAGALVLARAPLDHGALTGTWKDDPPGPDDWRARWWGPALDEARRRSAAFAATAHAHGLHPSEAALRFTLRDGWPHGTLVGVSNAIQAEMIARWWDGGPLDADVQEDLTRHAWPDRYG